MTKNLEGKKCPKFNAEFTSNLKLSNNDFLGKNLVIYFILKIALLGAQLKAKSLEIITKSLKNIILK